MLEHGQRAEPTQEERFARLAMTSAGGDELVLQAKDFRELFAWVREFLGDADAREYLTDFFFERDEE